MRISLNWLQELVDLPNSAEELAQMLTMAGFEVEDIEDRRTWAKGVVVGRVLSREAHPNADKLSVCTVNIGAAKPSTIVCGAANVRADIDVAVATVGTFLPKVAPDGLKIKPRKLRDVPSEGMICSLTELGLAKDSDGIYIFESSQDEKLQPGADVRPLLGLDDVVLDVTSTANRADVLSMVGLAREIAAITGATLRLPTPATLSIPKGQAGVSIHIADSQVCPRYMGTCLDGITIAPSPTWLQQRLQICGIRPINNVVDVTNYILLEWGQPLHAFDRDRLNTVAKSQKNLLVLGVRSAETHESLKTLDGHARDLQSQNVVITANNHPVALAGVMGGESTEVYLESQNLVLEAAVFDSASVRRSARAQGLRTEASTRYERGVNQAELELACTRAVGLIQELAGGQIVTQVSAGDSSQFNATRSIQLRLDRVQQVLGPVEGLDPAGNLGEIPNAEIQRILAALGCSIAPTHQQEWTVTVPPYRYRDLEREIDLIEEIARLYGYNNIVDTLPAKTEVGYLSGEIWLTRKIRESFRATGLTEVVHYSVVKSDPNGEKQQVLISNPIFTEYSALRTDLLSGLIDALQYNLEQGNGPLNGFEIGRVFWQTDEGLQEVDAVAGIMGGSLLPQGQWTHGGQEQPLSWYEAKGILEGVSARLGLHIEYQPDRRDPRFHPGRTASLWLEGDRLGLFGQLHPQLRQERGFPEAVYGFEMSLDILLSALDQDEQLVPIFRPFSGYPASDRDIAFFVSAQVSVADLTRVIHKAGGSLLDSVTLFDEYRGEHVPTGQRSLAFRLIYRASDRTLSDADIEPVHQHVRDALIEKFRATLRS
jgi:phenylalanyl-tRNA synthetase beta chain